MTIDYITRPEFEEHKNHLDTRFDSIETKIKHESELLREKIDKSTYKLKEEIQKEKLTAKRFWIGITVPSVLTVLSIIATFFT
ncbi:hypothetical protein MUA73_07930 [Staphylococcus simulans]|uniref:hypothetical protein n=1 Tax=Staphylococcus simulans TaxID=1286 RepID=UPI0021CE648B|nr:hypothetical protein [Staphylococcus simulans]UXR29338.1 hypothetical protein MUA73_07930 [Staphylococcus simulans]UXR32297.1 hypothetical protein MUA81_10415 [Staphylococcus simulans]